jgi:hypothetical protein
MGMLAHMARWHLHLELEFVRIEQYARERLGMSASAARALIALHKRLARCPRTRQALADGQIHLAHAEAIARIASERTEAAWLERAHQTTVRFLREDVAEATRIADLVAAADSGFPPPLPPPHPTPRSTRTTSCQTCAPASHPQTTCQTCAPASHPPATCQTCAPASRPQTACQTCAPASHPQTTCQTCAPASHPQATYAQGSPLAEAIGAPPTKGSEFRRLLQAVMHDLRSASDLTLGDTDDPSSDIPSPEMTTAHLADRGQHNPVGLGTSRTSPNHNDPTRAIPNHEGPARSSPNHNDPTRTSPTQRGLQGGPTKPQRLGIRFWLPTELEPMWQEASAAVALLHGILPSVSAIIEEVLDAYLAQWGDEAIEAVRSHPAIDRMGWRCAVPTCSSRANLHAHHIRYRSRGGGNQLANLVPLCAAHHLHGEHAGYLHVSGQAPHQLTWVLGLRPKQPGEPEQPAHLVVQGRRLLPSRNPSQPSASLPSAEQDHRLAS